MEAVHQVEAVKLHNPVKTNTLDKHRLFLLAGISSKDVCGLHCGGDGKCFDIRQWERFHHMPKVVAGETVMGGYGKEGFIPFLEPVKVFALKVIPRHDKMVDPKRDGKRGSQVVKEKVPIGSFCDHQGVDHVLTEILVQHLQLFGLVQEAIGRVCPQHIQQGRNIPSHLGKQPGEGVAICFHERLSFMTDGAAILDQGLKGCLILIQNICCEISSWISFLI